MLLAVVWRLRYKLGLRDLAELLLQRGYTVSHETIRAWEFRFTPLIAPLFVRGVTDVPPGLGTQTRRT